MSKLLRHTKLLLPCSITLLLAACGSDVADAPVSSQAAATAHQTSAAKPAEQTSADQTRTNAKQPVKAQQLGDFLSDDICNVLSKSFLQSTFSAPATIKSAGRHNASTSTCTWSWPRSDAAQRSQQLVKLMKENRSRKPGEKLKIDLSAMSTEFSLTVMLQKTTDTAANFVPPKLSDAQLQARIEQATAATEQRTGDNAPTTANNTAEPMAAKMIRLANERIEIKGTGDAAYWLPAMGGSLNVLDGNIRISISPRLADDVAGNVQAAKQVFKALHR